MRVDLLQVVAMAAHGSAFLVSRENIPEMMTSHSTFQTVNALEFRRVGSLHGGLIAESVLPWLRRLDSEGVILIRPLLAGCVRDGNDNADLNWGILTDGDRGMEVWKPTWRARFGRHDDDKPHRVVFSGSRLSRFHLPVVPSIEDAGLDLGRVLKSGVEKLRAAGQQHASIPLMQCLAQHREGSQLCVELPDLWPTEAQSIERMVAASALRAACAVTGLRAVPPTPLESEVLEEVWQVSLRALETSLARVSIAKVA